MADPTTEERLAAIRERARKATAGPWAQLEKATAERDAALAEVERLSAIVARLPKTADNVPCWSGQTGWAIEWVNGGAAAVTRAIVGPVPSATPLNEPMMQCHASSVYSTRAAAEAAAKAGGGE